VSAWSGEPILVAPYRVLFVPGFSFSASLANGEAQLRFPYDDRLRLVLRAIPGRRWDPIERAWCVPVDPERADALARLFRALPGRPDVSDALARAIERRRSRRRREECLVDLARPDENWWLSFATDAAAEPVAALLGHPEARYLAEIGRAVVPLDENALELIAGLGENSGLRLSNAAERALLSLAKGEDEPERRREPQVRAQPERPARWYGNVDVAGPSEAPVFLLLGDVEVLPKELREHASTVPGGAAVPLTLDSWRLIHGGLGGWISAATRRCVAALKEGRPAPPAVLERSSMDGEETFVLAPGHNAALLEEFAELRGVMRFEPGRSGRRRRRARAPALRADPFCVPELDCFLTEHEIWVEPEALERLQEVREEHARSAGLVELSAATDAPLEIAGLGGELKPFQRAGVAYLLSQRRAFLADEQGLGKTIEALATIQADGAYPALVVCPASLKLNWLAETRRWLPGRSVQVLSGGGGDEVPRADITIVNYDIVGSRLSALAALQPRALVLDESHYCKNAAAKRTQAVQRLSAVVPAEGLILALTGTPVMNRPAELISQLRILGRLEDFGSGVKFGARFQGPDAHLRLHWHLRSRCFARRLKADVLPQLPAKTRAVVPVELDNEPEYRFAERDVIAWLQSQPLDLRELDAKVAAALRAERLVRLNALKLLAVRGKLHAARTWIHDFCSSGERLVVFAHHREIQHALVEHFPRALHILGEDSPVARDRALREFQAPDNEANQLIVCSTEVAGQGITLTRSSNVVFLELDWTPARHDQAEDRCHRIGQQDAVNASYLLAAHTIDETISTLLERKRAVIGAVTDGREQDEEGVVDALVRELRGTPYRHLRAVA